MAEKSPFHSKFRADGYTSRGSPSAKVTKRHRVPLSCAPCRVKKSGYLCCVSSFADYARLRCNRAQPCEHCMKRGDADSCSYATAADSGNKTQHTEDQLHCLENLVAEAIKLHQDKTQDPVRNVFSFVHNKASVTVRLIQNSMDSTLNPPSGVSEGLLPGISTPEGDHSTTVGPTTWTVILGNVFQSRVLQLHCGADLQRYKTS